MEKNSSERTGVKENSSLQGARAKMNLQGVLIGVVLLIVGVVVAALTREAGIAKEATDGEKMLYYMFLIVSVLGFVITCANLKASAGKTISTEKLILAAMLAALSYIGFAVFKIDIPVPGTMEKTAFHFGNVFCVLAALFLDGLWGGLAGAVGMTIADLFAGYMTSSPKTFVLKLCIGLIVGLVAHKLFKIKEEKDPKAILWKTAVASAAGMAFNVVAEPTLGYVYKRFLQGIPQDAAAILSKLTAVTTLVNAVVAVFAAVVFYNALRPVLIRIGSIGRVIGPDKNKK